MSSHITRGRKRRRRLRNELRSAEINAREHRTTLMRSSVRGQINGG